MPDTTDRLREQQTGTTDDLTATLEGWRKIAQAATPGPWEADVLPALKDLPVVLLPDPGDDEAADLLFAADSPQATEADAVFIATARTAFPRLVTALEAVLKLADDWMNTPWPEDGGDRAGVATEQIILDGTSLREAITRALTGKGESDDR